MNKLFPIVLALLFFGCDEEATTDNDSQIVSFEKKTEELKKEIKELRTMIEKLSVKDIKTFQSSPRILTELLNSIEIDSLLNSLESTNYYFTQKHDSLLRSIIGMPEKIPEDVKKMGSE